MCRSSTPRGGRTERSERESEGYEGANAFFPGQYILAAECPKENWGEGFVDGFKQYDFERYEGCEVDTTNERLYAPAVKQWHSDGSTSALDKGLDYAFFKAGRVLEVHNVEKVLTFVDLEGELGRVDFHMAYPFDGGNTQHSNTRVTYASHGVVIKRGTRPDRWPAAGVYAERHPELVGTE